MNKRLLACLLGLLAMGGVAVWLIVQYAEADARLPAFTENDFASVPKTSSNPPSPPPIQIPKIDPSHPVRLAVGRIGLANEEADRQVSDLILAQLAGAPGLELIERHLLDKALDEIQLSLTQLVRAKDAVRVGKIVRADWFLLGTPATINGSNSVVVRIVDARTGVLREAGVFSAELGTPQLAGSLTAFVRQCRQNAAEARAQVYLAIGSFEDLSLNNRQAALPGQMRSYLTANAVQ